MHRGFIYLCVGVFTSASIAELHQRSISSYPGSSYPTRPIVVTSPTVLGLDLGQLEALHRSFQQLSQRRPGMKFRLLSNLHIKLETSELVTVEELMNAIADPHRFSQLDESEIGRLKRAVYTALSGNRSGSGGRSPQFSPQPGPPRPSPHSPGPQMGPPGSPRPPAPSPRFAPGGGVAGDLFDKRARSDQQGSADCWAFSAQTACQLALAGKGNDAPARHLAETSSQLFTAAYLGPEPQFETEELRAAWKKSHSIASELSRATGGQAISQIGGVISYIQRLGLGNVLAMKAMSGQRSTGGGSDPILDTILEGMKLGVRFSGYFDRRHAMAIVGVDKKTNSVIVSDSMQGGATVKVSLSRNHLDGMVGFVRKDYTDGAQWLNSQ